MVQRLPIDAILPQLRSALAAGPNCVLEAPPGAGKTTRAPLALLDEPWLTGKKIVMLEPRRVAARAAAARMAAELGESVGERVGYRVRLESKIGPTTRIEVLTEGLLTRRMQVDPELPGVGLLIFDEFHERSLNADLGLALALEAQEALNEDLRILVMSATLDGARVAALLRGAPVIRAEGRMFPIDTRYAPSDLRLEQAIPALVRRAMRETQGGVLVFLPGEAEIRRVERELSEFSGDPAIAVMPLYGAMQAAAQDAAIRPAPPGVRKIVLATSIAETSLTIEDVRVVIDCGLQRLPRYDPATGFTQLVTQPVSLAAADQRRGRAGRVAAGVCYRMWDERQSRAMRNYTPPEILTADLAPLALDLALWGAGDPANLALLDQPPAGVMAEARALLRSLRALDDDGRITAHGKAMAMFGAHPRLAHMMLAAEEAGEGATAAAAAAVLNERDILRLSGQNRDADLRNRLDVLRGGRDDRADRGALARAREQIRAWRRGGGAEIDPSAAGRAIALAFPDRVAQRRGPGSFRMASGRGATLDETDALAREEFLAVAVVGGADANARIHLAAPLSRSDIEEIFAGDIRRETNVVWDAREKAVAARSESRLGALVLSSQQIANPAPAALEAAALQGVREMGLACLSWTEDAQRFRTRLAFVRALEPDADWPDMSDAGLLASLETWLAPYLNGTSRAAHFARLDTAAALKSLLPWERQRRLDGLAPEAVSVPSGSRIAIDYAPDGPVLAVRLQELFGMTETPTVGGGSRPLTLHLLSPARRPVQVTQDLRSFWTNGYPLVKKDLKGRYPKHFWPDDPWTAQATARAKPRGT